MRRTSSIRIVVGLVLNPPQGLVVVYLNKKLYTHCLELVGSRIDSSVIYLSCESFFHNRAKINMLIQNLWIVRSICLSSMDWFWNYFAHMLSTVLICDALDQGLELKGQGQSWLSLSRSYFNIMHDSRVHTICLSLMFGLWNNFAQM